MSYKTKISLFPYNCDTAFICNYAAEIKDYDIYSIISYEGFPNGTVSGVIQTDQAFDAICKSDGILLSDYMQQYSNKAYINRIKEASVLKKKVMLSSYMYQWLGENLFSDVDTMILNDFPQNEDKVIPVLKSINCPIIGIFGMGDNCDKWKVLLTLKRNFEVQNYKVLALCSNPLGSLLGCELLPSFLYDKNLSYAEKVFRINHHIYKLVKENKPDVVLISSAGGLAYLQESVHNYFGELSRVLLNALEIDYGIICTYFNSQYTTEYFEEMREVCYNKLGIDVFAFYISGQKLRILGEEQKIEYDFYDDFYRQTKISSEIFSPGNVFMKEQIGAVADKLIDLLSTNIEII